MKIVKLRIRIPYQGRGVVLSRLYKKVYGKVHDVHILPPTVEGMSEILMEIEAENPAGLISEIKRLLKNGRVSFRILSEV